MTGSPPPAGELPALPSPRTAGSLAPPVSSAGSLAPPVPSAGSLDRSAPSVDAAELSPPGPGECQVWRLPKGPEHWAGFDDVLDEEERARHARFLRAADRERYQAAHVGLRLLLGHYLGVPPAALRFSRHCRHCGAGHGKPVVSAPVTGLDFSLTHSGDWVGLAVAAEPVGVDVQELTDGTDVAALSGSVLSPAELRWWADRPAENSRRAFFGYWARKEALLKATGHGIVVPMKTITLSPPDEPAQLLDWAARQSLDSPVWLQDFDAGPDYAAAVAVLSGRPFRLTRGVFSAADLGAAASGPTGRAGWPGPPPGP